MPIESCVLTSGAWEKLIETDKRENSSIRNRESENEEKEKGADGCEERRYAEHVRRAVQELAREIKWESAESRGLDELPTVSPARPWGHNHEFADNCQPFLHSVPGNTNARLLRTSEVGHNAR